MPATQILLRTQYSRDNGATWITYDPATGILTTLTPAGAADYTPTGLRVLALGATTVILWKDGPSGAPDSYTFERNGNDSTGAGPWVSGINPKTTHTATFGKLVPGATYTLTVRAFAALSTWAATIMVTIPTARDWGITGSTIGDPVILPTRPPSTGEPLAGRSGLGFTSIRFDGGRPSLTTLTAAGRDRGRPFDGALWFITRNGGWGPYTDMYQYGDTKVMLDAGLTVVTSLPHAPENLGTSINILGAKDAFHDEQRRFGEFLAAHGLNTAHHVIRVGWEFNGDWYKWSVAYGGPAAFRDAVANFITNVRAGGADKVVFDLCANIDSATGATWANVWPGDGYFSIIGIDQYDMWPPSFTQAVWDTKQARVLSMAGAAAFASAHGVRWALDEAGNAHGSNGGGDNPAYWGYQHATLMKNVINLAHHTTYDEAGTGGLDHTLNDNPKSKAAYITYYGAGAS